MRLRSDIIHFSASDLSSHISCQHLTQLKLKVARKELVKPFFESATLDVLRLKGQEFEQAFLDQLRSEGKTIVHIQQEDLEAESMTLQAMKDGVDYIYQAKLRHDIWMGWADFLKKVDTPSNLGNWSYEVIDTKLAKETKAGSILQICLYSYIIGKWQGILPEHMYIKTPEQFQPYRVDDFMAYFRLIQKRLTEAVEQEPEIYPEPVAHCDICDWWERCNKIRRADDHLAFIAGMGSSPIREVRNWNVNTLKEMATLPLPLPQKPLRGSIDTYTKLREQARVQLASRESGKPVYEVLPIQPDYGFYKLPEPSEGDVFFDFEGDPFVGDTGREYLFGWVFQGNYEHFWAVTELEEKKAFENFVDGIMKIWSKYPHMHIYHFAPYEPSALKRLMGKYGTRETEIDNMLRAGMFVDLHAVAKQAIRAGVESYSLKELEKFHKFLRKRDLRLVSREKMQYECLLEAGTPHDAPQETIDVVRDYNEDDCRSTESLRNWLEQLRADEIKKGIDISRPEIRTGEAGENITDHQARIKPLYDTLMKDLPFEKENRNIEQEAKWLLANMLDWYRREQKSYWWEYFRLCDLPDDELMDERAAIAGLSYTGERTPDKKSVIDKYRFPVQETDIQVGDELKSKGETVGKVYDIDPEAGIIYIRRGNAKADIHPNAVFSLKNFKTEEKEEAIIRLSEWVVGNDISANGPYQAGRHLLLRSNPLTTGLYTITDDPQTNAVHWVKALDNSILPIQGPPGAGKSHTAAEMILELIRSGKKVGITALGHKVITNLLEKVMKTAKDRKVKVSIVQKVKDLSSSPRWTETDKNEVVIDLLNSNKANIAAGTSFMWAREEFFEAVDVMFVDEAGQLSLIDTLALSHSAKNLVLLGDPQQLKQPQKGSHPEGTALSALEHILQEQKTIHPEQGVFLDKTWRLHPSICQFNSELFYEKRLSPNAENANQRLDGNTPYANSGIYYEAVTHEGNKNCSEEEVTRVKQIVKDLTNGTVYWNDKHNTRKKLLTSDIMVIAPYNAQVHELKEALPEIHVGTVDKFQGQEAPVVIFSMTTSSPEDAPRGMEFLYSLNRLNVAVSRARAVFILVASPKLFEPDCKSPDQMRLANALCRLKEMAVQRDYVNIQPLMEKEN